MISLTKMGIRFFVTILLTMGIGNRDLKT